MILLPGSVYKSRYGRQLKESRTTYCGTTYRININFFPLRYHEYTDATFTKVLTAAPDEGGRAAGQRGEHLGLLGPLLRAQVGDTIKVRAPNTVADSSRSTRHMIFEKTQ